MKNFMWAVLFCVMVVPTISLAESKELTQDHIYYMQGLAVISYCTLTYNIDNEELIAEVFRRQYMNDIININLREVVQNIPEYANDRINDMIAFLLWNDVVIDCPQTIKNILNKELVPNKE